MPRFLLFFLHVGYRLAALCPKLRRQTFETAIIERYQRHEISVEEALVEMYLAGVSVRRVEDITEALWGTRVSPSTVSTFLARIKRKLGLSTTSELIRHGIESGLYAPRP